MDDYESGEQNPKLSKYNSGVAQIYRLDELWKDTHKHRRNGLLEFWNWDLDSVWLELAGDIEETDPRVTTFNDINLNINELQSQLNKKVIRYETFRQKFYLLLMKKELFLRRLQNEIGKGSAYLDDMDDYFDD